MFDRLKFAAAIGIVLVLAGCASTSFVSTWKNPEAQPINRAKGQTIVALVMADDNFIRQGAEDALAAELTRRGQNGVACYRVLPAGITEEAEARAAFEKIGAVAVVAMRPLAVDLEATATTVAVYGGPYYGGFWGGYWGYGWGYPYGATTVTSDTVVYVETLFYSLTQNKLVWSGKSRTTNPDAVASFVKGIVQNAVWEMNKAKVFAK